MRYTIILAALAVAACATPRDPALDAYPDRQAERMADERAKESVERMQDEFNRIFPDG